MRTLFEPRLVHDDTHEPGLVVDFRDERRALLVDLGEIAHLPPRVLMRVSHAFVTHAHMDHFAGFDHLLRVVLGRKERLALVGGPGFATHVEHKLLAYAWNVVHRYETPLTIEVVEVRADGTRLCTSFDSRRAFARGEDRVAAPEGDVVHNELAFRVRARLVDHDIPCLALALEEKVHVNVRKERVAALGFGTGAWLRELKHAVLRGDGDDAPIDVRWRDRDGNHHVQKRVGELRSVILDVVPGQRIGYVTDLRFTEANVEALAALLAGVDRLFIECVFAEADREHAARKNHLTARQAGTIARIVGAKAVTPFHFSPRYEGREHELVAEMEAEWASAGPDGNPATTTR